MWGFTVDDAFITFRYARNWAEGFGPTYNPGGGPAEGYTTFLWMLLMTLPHLLRLDVVPFAKIVGMAAMLGCGAVIFAFANHLLRNLSDGRRYLLAAGAVLLFAITPATAYPCHLRYGNRPLHLPPHRVSLPPHQHYQRRTIDAD